MAQTQSFKTFINSDVVTTRTLLHEKIPITGSMLSGTYNQASSATREENIKAHTHGMFQSVYDYPYLSSSSNHIFDIAIGASPNAPTAPDYKHTTQFDLSTNITDAIVNQKDKKKNMYSQMAQLLVGYGESGSIKNFDVDGNFNSEEDKILAPTFFNFSRLLVKDEIKKGSFELDLGVGPLNNPFKHVIKLSDYEATGSYRTNSPAGEYGILLASDVNTSDTTIKSTDVGLFTSSLTPAAQQRTPIKVGLVYYQAGVVVLNSAALLYASGSPGTAGGGNVGATENSSSVPLYAENPTGVLNPIVCPTGSAELLFTDKPNETTTITLRDAEGTTVVFETDDTGDGAAGSNVAVDGAGAAGFATALHTAINANAIKITSTNPSSGKIELSQDLGGLAGNTTITTSHSSWASSTSTLSPTFSGGQDFVDFMKADGSTYHTGSYDLGLVSASVDQMADSWRRRVQNVKFNNTTELNSTVYFCRAHHNEFNYSSNPTYLTGSEIRVKDGKSTNPPHSYITTVGLYSADNELLAVAKVSEPIKKSSETEVNLRVRLDY